MSMIQKITMLINRILKSINVVFTFVFEDIVGAKFWFKKCFDKETSWGWTGPSSAQTGLGLYCSLTCIKLMSKK